MSYVLAVTWKAKRGQAEAVRDILRRLRNESIREAGVLRFDIHVDADDPDRFFLYEKYRNEEDHARHMQTPHFKDLVLNRAIPLLEHRERRFCHPLP